MEWTLKKIILAIFFALIMILSVFVFIMILRDETFLFETIKDYFIIPLLDIGFWAVFVFLFLMVLQSLIAPIPSELILLSGAMIFGFGWGTVIGVIGSMLSAWITYYVSNQGGRTILEATGEKISFVDKFVLVMDEWIQKWGLWAIIVGRAVPVIMFDPVSYASGLSNVKFQHYSIATFIGSIPRALFYSWLGIQTLDGRDPSALRDMDQTELDAASNKFNTIFFIIFAVLVVMFVIANIIANKKDINPRINHKAQESEKSNES